MKFYKITFFLLLLLAPITLLAQEVQLVILDKDTRETLPGATLQAENLETQVSNNNGLISFIPAQNYFVKVSHVAYESQSFQLRPGMTREVLLERKSTALGEVVVSAFETDRPLLEQGAAISRVSEADLYRFNERSIVQAFNTKPGIRVEERAPASYRISIRGSALRSPFGVRNVKVYWNDMPFTFPDGTTPLNLLDLSNIQNSEIIKGPAGSIYGAGNGGVINLQSLQQPNQNKISSELGFGDFGMLRYRFAVDQRTENGGISASYVHQQSDGYRDHSAVDRKVFQLGGHFSPSAKQTISTNILYSDLNYQIPGALTEGQLLENPQMARPGSVEQNSSIAQKSLYAGVTHSYQILENLENVTSAYVQTSEFENPFILDYKRELQHSYGGRTKFVFQDQLGSVGLRLIAGGEYQYGKTAAQNFGNRDGVADTVRFADDLITTQGFLFQQAEFELPSDLILTLAFSENFSRYDINRSIDAQTGVPSGAERRFDPVIIPRIAVVKRIGNNAAVHASVSSGFSPPTIAEVRTNEGSINLDLDAERGVNYEAGYRAGWWQGRVNLDASLFYFRLDQTITSFTNEQGVVLFRNAGATDQRGIEALLDYTLVQNPNAFLSNLKFTHAFTGHYFEFRNYESGGNDFSGNKLTGVAPNSLVNQFDLTTSLGFYLNLTHHFVDEIPLNDGNTVFQEAYNLVSARLGWRKTFINRWDLEVYAGGENLLDESYSLGNDLNAFAGRYYQPAPGRNYFGGLKVGFRY
ncbi:TonB-dependent receptor plug domain-containing protein [Litoribacter alkaliphilus]|uniref:TonB-dependent receptor plug domain-containing protein n=1 Tax=Litoribacter ruber TaxID=702568 RepID=A0AAP2CIT9_9BACT|nr:TonB-dependent receptor plug domain-containing protein [Litoribacter alkaliphilus]MBS9523365.1 TonB-dependent receptor plug domain-containing protein [Litoribacter alkaliphilus]